MQLIRIIGIALQALQFTCTFYLSEATAQGTSEPDTLHDQLKERKILSETEMNFLFSYYDQEGNHSPVTGGIGTEKFSDIAPLVVLNVPVDSSKQLSLSVGLDDFTCASCAYIRQPVDDKDAMSSASSTDIRVHADLGFINENRKRKRSLGGSAGFSKEFDVLSVSGGLSYVKTHGNHEVNLAGKFYYDSWLLIYPFELRNLPEYQPKENNAANNKDGYGTDSRRSTYLSLTYSATINTKTQVAFLCDFVYQEGLLSTPFHRVYFDDGVSDIASKTVKVEHLPYSRYKIPVGIRVNRYLNDWFILRFYYRHYFDSFQLKANTFEVEVPVKLGSFFTLKPFYRYQNQQGTIYFKGYGEHSIDSEFFTSDYDLSSFISNKYGLAISFSSIDYIFRIKIPGKNSNFFRFRKVEVRGGYYTKSTDFHAYFISLDTGWGF